MLSDLSLVRVLRGEPPANDEVFRLSLLADTLVLPVFAIIFLLAGVVSLLSGIPPPVLSALLAFVISLLLLVSYAWFQHTFDVREALFLDNSFRVKINGRTEECGYNQIETVYLINTRLSNIVFGAQVGVRLIGQQSTLILYRNPKNRQLKMDLYSWIRAKVQTRTGMQQAL